MNDSKNNKIRHPDKYYYSDQTGKPFKYERSDDILDQKPSDKEEKFSNQEFGEWFKGYGCEKSVHPFYLTTSSEYGRFGPNSFTMNRNLHLVKRFTGDISSQGQQRSRALNVTSKSQKT